MGSVPIIFLPYVESIMRSSFYVFCTYSRMNDDATNRRKLLHEFGKDVDATPESFRVVPKNIHFEQAYWVNQRYVHYRRKCLLSEGYVV
jgi:putative salt-induced outer membrane protein YdiY